MSGRRDRRDGSDERRGSVETGPSLPSSRRTVPHDVLEDRKTAHPPSSASAPVPQAGAEDTPSSESSPFQHTLGEEREAASVPPPAPVPSSTDGAGDPDRCERTRREILAATARAAWSAPVVVVLTRPDTARAQALGSGGGVPGPGPFGS